MIELTVILPTHRPHPGRLRRTLVGLRSQTLASERWETVLIDNASTPALAATDFGSDSPANLRVLREPVLGLSHARRCGFQAARGAILVLVDDDNVLAPDYLTQVLNHFAKHPAVGAVGGRSLPEFEIPMVNWQKEFSALLALRDLGPQVIISEPFAPDSPRLHYPDCAPIGAGMALRRAAAEPWLLRADPAALTDRLGDALTSGGDNDIVLHALRAGWSVAYFPELVLTHLIPASRLQPVYLARLNRGIQRSWMQVLSLHHANPWPPLTPLGARLRMLKAWFRHFPLFSRTPAARIRWLGTVGHFEGRIRP